MRRFPVKRGRGNVPSSPLLVFTVRGSTPILHRHSDKLAPLRVIYTIATAERFVYCRLSAPTLAGILVSAAGNVAGSLGYGRIISISLTGEGGLTCRLLGTSFVFIFSNTRTYVRWFR
ncbi:hypothetical protein GGC63_003353 [Paenibacillus sp. OAS669]|nr:hypothetical protein [Paenibacillus sp. OAS669]